MHKKPQSNSIRIIAGEWRGRRLRVLDREGLRPTTDRVRETVFNWLMPDISGARCLDLFAGTGALGLESLSRGAAFVQFCELDRAAAGLLANNVNTLLSSSRGSSGSERADVMCSDALRYLKQIDSEPYDIIFLDPPFDGLQLLRAVLRLIHQRGLLAADGLVYIENNRFDDPFSDSDEADGSFFQGADGSLIQAADGSLTIADGSSTLADGSPVYAEYRSKEAGKARFGLYVYKGCSV